ncbi:aminomethyl-transferring glycine dehydrogenase subunit GcvPA [Sphingomonas kaistensis]|uniref:Probable glycine dehydrogenase (decarboxylating) subunit 1 n=1 Tax=Sphingomonas kaistensis TaxID=298708 RepID=A0ABZ2G2X2_9SPHN
MRYLPLSDTDRSEMLATIGAASVDDLFRDVPEEARLDGPIHGLPLHASELSVERQLTALARKNLPASDAPFFLGCGAYKHHIPASVDHLIQRGEFLTAYTPYQPEIAQGTLQVLFEFQSQVARLYGCEVANASMYDGSTACWEAIGMARRVTRKTKTLISSGLHPHYVGVCKTMAKFTGDTLETAAPTLTAETDVAGLADRIDGETSAVVVQYPDILGRVADLQPLADAAHAKGALLIVVVTEPVALGLLKSPGEMGADIVVGEGQSIGVGLNFGGPYVGLFACREKHIRQMPGRIAGETIDADGKRGFVLTLSTREQHIRREKATSNICTNSGLCALAFSIHMTLLGEKGLRQLAELNHARARLAADKLAAIPGVRLINDLFFNEFTLELPVEARPAVHRMVEAGVLGGVSLGRLYPGEAGLANGLVVAVTETATDEDIDALTKALTEAVK